MRCYCLDARTPTTGSPNFFWEIHFGCKQTSADTVHVYVHCVNIKIRKLNGKSGSKTYKITQENFTICWSYSAFTMIRHYVSAVHQGRETCHKWHLRVRILGARAWKARPRGQGVSRCWGHPGPPTRRGRGCPPAPPPHPPSLTTGPCPTTR